MKESRFERPQGYNVQKYRVQLVRDGVERVLPLVHVEGAWHAAEVFASVLKGLPHEEVWMILVDGRNRIRGLVKLSQGGAHGTALKPADVFRPVIAAGVDAFILGHNHPSGDPSPSSADREMTQLLIEASKSVGVTCLDHIVWTELGGWRSLRETMVFDVD
jgi:DNA repair protein RadC